MVAAGVVGEAGEEEGEAGAGEGFLRTTAVEAEAGGGIAAEEGEEGEKGEGDAEAEKSSG
jgi:hypothetical protein